MKKKKVITLGRNFQILEFPLHIDWSKKHSNCSFHSHGCTELVVVRSGSARHITRLGNSNVKKGDVFVIPKGESHRYDDVDEFYIVNTLFKMSRLPIPTLDAWRLPGFGDLFATPEESFQKKGASSILTLSTMEYKNTMELLEALSEEECAGSRFLMISLFMRLIYNLSTAYRRMMPKKEGDVSLNIERVIEHLHKRLTEKININELTRISGMSTSGLTRSFKKATGMSPINYLIGLRINEATRLLTNTKLYISEIADRTGFGDSNYFCKAFVRMVGTSPTKFRRENESPEL